jgi:hypothetical protein
MRPVQVEFARTGGGEDLLAVADGGDGLAGLDKVPHQIQHLLIQCQILRGSPPGNHQPIVPSDRCGGEVCVEFEVVARLLSVGLVTLEVVDGSTAYVARFLARANGVDGITVAEQGLERNHDLIIFHVITA